jgi:hypothetical protein
MTLVSSVAVNVSGNYSIAADLATKTCNLLKTYSSALASGTGAAQADLVFHDRRTLAASATEDLDLAGSLVDLLTGAPMAFARLKAILVVAAAANVNSVVVSRPATNGVPILSVSGAVSVPPNGVFLLHAPGAAGFLVTAATGDLITFTNSAAGSSVTYDVVLIGASA